VKRREFITLLGGAVATWPLAARAQQHGKLPVVGVLVSASPPHPFADAMRRGLQNLGYSEGGNIVLEFRYSGGRSDRAGEIAAEFVRLGVDVIVAHFTPAVRAALGATQKIPIVMAPQAVIVQPLFDPYRATLIELATKHRLALMSGSRETTAAGGVISISANFLALYERAAPYVDKIIKGANPATLPVEQPTKFQVVLNTKTAQALSLTISPTLLAQADEVIE
jgi:ABC-type uncharacterized transport system substrate-binding protein